MAGHASPFTSELNELYMYISLPHCTNYKVTELDLEVWFLIAWSIYCVELKDLKA